jgi:membrane-bound ClpP family serine protease
MNAVRLGRAVSSGITAMAYQHVKRKPVLSGSSLLAVLFGTFLFFVSSTALWAQTGDTQAVANAAQTTQGGAWNYWAHVLVQPWWTIALLVAGCSLLYHDLLTPHNWGVTGTLGVLCVGAVFAAQVTVGAAYLGVLLLLAGLALILLEIHAFPGYGSALAGFVLMYAGMFLSLDGTHHAGFALTVTTVLTVIAGVAFLIYLPKSPAWQRLGQRMAQQGTLGVCPPDEAHLVGKQGRTTSRLRPSGTATIEGAAYNVITEGDFLDEGARIVVTQVEGDRVLVEPAEATVGANVERARVV